MDLIEVLGNQLTWIMVTLTALVLGYYLGTVRKVRPILEHHADQPSEGTTEQTSEAPAPRGPGAH